MLHLERQMERHKQKLEWSCGRTQREEARAAAAIAAAAKSATAAEKLRDDAKRLLQQWKDAVVGNHQRDEAHQVGRTPQPSWCWCFTVASEEMHCTFCNLFFVPHSAGSAPLKAPRCLR